MRNKIFEYDNALYINDYRVPFVIKDSVLVDRSAMQVTLTLSVSEYHRISDKKEPVEVYKFSNNLPE